jgi:type I restriction enzyme S subunit
LAAKIDEAKTLQTQVDHGLDGVCRSIIQNSSDGRPAPTPMAQLVRLRQPDVDVKAEEAYQFAGVYCFGRGIFVGQRKTGMEFKYSRLTRLKTGNFVYPKLMAWEGALGIVPPECDGLVVSTEFPVFEIDDEKVLPEVLDVYFRTPSVWPELSGASTGTNVRRRRLNPGDFLRYEFPLPPMTTQLKLREVTRRAEEVRRYRNPARKELAAMLPAILDRAFRGAL